MNPERDPAGNRRPRRLPLICSWLMAVLLSPGWLVTTAYGAGDLENEVKAAMIYNFAKFVRWPRHNGSADRPLVVAIVGDDPFGDTLERLTVGKTVDRREIQVVRYTSPGDVGRCDVLFIAQSRRRDLGLLLQETKSREVLTVGDMAGFTEAGGIIEFKVQDNRVRFEINVDAAERSGLKISSKLLSLATAVRKEGR